MLHVTLQQFILDQVSQGLLLQSHVTTRLHYDVTGGKQDSCKWVLAQIEMQCISHLLHICSAEKHLFAE